MQQDHRPALSGHFVLDAGFACFDSHQSPLIADDDGQQLATAWSRNRLVAPAGSKAVTLSSKPGRAATSATRFNSMALLTKPRKQSASLKAAAAKAWLISQPGSRGRYSLPAMRASISASR